MSSMFDYDDSINLAFDAKIAGKKLVTAKHEVLTKTGDFLFLAHSDRELAFRMQMVEEDIEKVAHRKLANVSDSKAKLVRALYEEWSIRHASCEFCKGSDPHAPKKAPNKDDNENSYDPRWEIPADPHAKPKEDPYKGIPNKDPNAKPINPNGGISQFGHDKKPNKLDHTKFINDPNGNK